MAKSKSGGTRSFLRGRIGSDVYSIGKDGKGKRQQVVRSLAEQVANPQTRAQMFGRMYMSTVMQAVSAMSVIIDHSFDNALAGQPNISEFIRVNYNLIKSDATAHPASGNVFGLNQYGEKGAKVGAYQVSYGKAALPTALAIAADGVATITIAEAGITVAALKTLLGLSSDEYFTLVGFTAAKEFGYCRLRIAATVPEDTVVNAANLPAIFAYDGDIEPTLAMSGNNVTITTGLSLSNGIIVSRKTATGYQHNTCVLSAPTDPEWSANVAIATYPVGSQRFLNGGNVNGEQSGEVEPDFSVVSLTADGSNVSIGSSLTGDAAKNMVLTTAHRKDGVTYKVTKKPQTSSTYSDVKTISSDSTSFTTGAPESQTVDFYVEGSDGTRTRLFSWSNGD